MIWRHGALASERAADAEPDASPCPACGRLTTSAAVPPGYDAAHCFACYHEIIQRAHTRSKGVAL